MKPKMNLAILFATAAITITGPTSAEDVWPADPQPDPREFCKRVSADARSVMRARQTIPTPGEYMSEVRKWSNSDMLLAAIMFDALWEARQFTGPRIQDAVAAFSKRWHEECFYHYFPRQS